MDSTDKRPSLVAAIKTYFGMDNATCVKEYKALTDDDKAYFIAEFAKVGVEVRPVGS